jgi:peptide-methionine (S)-S-oxide reductase
MPNLTHRTTLSIATALLLISLAALYAPIGVRAASPDAALPSPELDPPVADSAGLQTAVLSGGCFWGVQGVFEHVAGVKHVVAGYAGGQKETASYEEVSAGTTGHAESVKITFDPQKISYGQILRIFFSVALDPTQLNRQGPDEGTQYRSEIFYNNKTQRDVGQAYIVQLDKAHIFPAPIVTRVEPNTGFFPAEEYHQDYLVYHPQSLYIIFNDLPKIANLKKLFPGIYSDKPVLTLPVGTSAQ